MGDVKGIGSAAGMCEVISFWIVENSVAVAGLVMLMSEDVVVTV